MVEPGTHTARATQWEFALTKGGAEQIIVQFEVMDGPSQGQCINWYGHFTDKTTNRTLEALRYCGWKSNDIDKLDGMGDYLVQIVVELELQEEGKNAGKEFPKVRWVNRLGGGGPIKVERPLDAGQRKMFAARMRLHASQVPPMVGGYPARQEKVPGADRAVTEKPDGAANDPF
jgi:hypothetical protein